MKAKTVRLPEKFSKPPHTCIVTGRRDGAVIDFGDPHPKACGPGDPRVYVRAKLVEEAAVELLAMRPGSEVLKLEAELAEANAEAGRLRRIVAGSEELMQAEEGLLEALGAAA